VDTRRLVLGDWTPLVRDGIDVLRGSLLLGAVGFAVAGDLGGALLLGGFGAATLLARVVNLPRPYDLGFVLAMLLQGWGEALAAYDKLPWFDNVVHFLLPCLLAPVIYIALARIEVLLDPKDETYTRHYVGIFVITFSIGSMIGAVWELAEWAGDTWLGTNLQKSNIDTVGDLLFDTIGALVGAGLLVVWTRFSWGSVRRIPGENRYEATDATTARTEPAVRNRTTGGQRKGG
jgi:hypothetical protein